MLYKWFKNIIKVKFKRVYIKKGEIKLLYQANKTIQLEK